MKNLIFLSILISCLISCGSNESELPEIQATVDNVDEVQPQQPAVTAPEIKPGEYIEYHPSGGIKIKGIYNNNLQREGLWISYYETGIKWSEAYYVEGMRDGHNVTFYPSGKIRYVGEYKKDVKIGTWTFYDENGDITKTETY